MSNKLSHYIKNYSSSKTWVTCCKDIYGGNIKFEFFYSGYFSETLPQVYLFTVDNHRDFKYCVEKFIDELSYNLIDEFEFNLPEYLYTDKWMVDDKHHDTHFEYKRNKLDSQSQTTSDLNSFDFNTLSIEDKNFILGITKPFKAIVLSRADITIICFDLRTKWFYDYCIANNIEVQNIVIGNYNDVLSFRKEEIESELKSNEIIILEDAFPVRSFINEYRQYLSILFKFNNNSDDLLDYDEYKYCIKLINNYELDIYSVQDILTLGNLPQSLVDIIVNQLPLVILVIQRENYWYIYLIEILKIYDLHPSIMQITVDAIERIPTAQKLDFYIACVHDDIKYPAAFSQIKQSDFDSWETEDQISIINHIADLISNQEADFLLVPDCLRNRPSILLAFVSVYFDRTDNEKDIFKKAVKESGLHKDFKFICQILKYDDGSVAQIIADESILDKPEYWLEAKRAYYHSPREIVLPDQLICGIPDKFMNDFSFILELIAINPEIILSLEDHWKENEELCKIVLEKNGLLLEFLPESVKKNPHLAAIAIKQNPEATLFISDELTYDVDFIKKVVNTNKKVLEYAIPRMKYLFHND